MRSSADNGSWFAITSPSGANVAPHWIWSPRAAGEFLSRAVRAESHTGLGAESIGVHGRSGEWLDSVGLICGPARVTPLPAGNPVQPLGNKGPVKALGRVAPPPIDSAPKPVCESARMAREKNSPAWPGLQRQCGATLAPLGEAIANQDPLSAALRSRTHNDAARRGSEPG